MLFQPVFDSFPFTPCFCLLFIIICIIINIGTLISYRKHCKKNIGFKTNQQIKQERTEYKLMIYAIFTFIGHALMAIEQILLYIVSGVFHQYDYIGAIFTQYPWTLDVGSVVLPSWLLFWASDKFRKYLIKDFVPKCF
uniref:Serpentine receptor class gamma n=1 Tax=Meloidogyne hapla TaxID=6305 RepID=A0A1I8B0Q8_MELHA